TNELPGSNFEESHKIQSSHLGTLNNQFAQARAAGIRLRAELEEIDSAHGDPSLLRQLVLADAGARWGDLQGQHLQLKRELGQLETRYGPQHPKVVELRQALSVIEHELDQEAATAVAALHARARGNGSEQSQLRAAIAEETHKAVELRKRELDYNRLRRQL